MTDDRRDPERTPDRRRAPWRAPSVVIAALLAVAGLTWWGLLATGVLGSEEAAAAVAPGMTSLDGAPVRDESAPPDRTLESSALFRFGASYVGGYLLGWVGRRFLKLTLLLAGAAAIGIYALQASGLFDVDWNSVQEQASAGAEWATEQAGVARTWLTGYLPSAFAAGAGALFGARGAR